MGLILLSYIVPVLFLSLGERAYFFWHLSAHSDAIRDIWKGDMSQGIFFLSFESQEIIYTQ